MEDPDELSNFSFIRKGTRLAVFDSATIILFVCLFDNQGLPRRHCCLSTTWHLLAVLSNERFEVTLLFGMWNIRRICISISDFWEPRRSRSGRLLNCTGFGIMDSSFSRSLDITSLLW